jgi:hypothetical protein
LRWKEEGGRMYRTTRRGLVRRERLAQQPFSPPYPPQWRRLCSCAASSRATVRRYALRCWAHALRLRLRIRLRRLLLLATAAHPLPARVRPRRGVGHLHRVPRAGGPGHPAVLLPRQVRDPLDAHARGCGPHRRVRLPPPRAARP